MKLKDFQKQIFSYLARDEEGARDYSFVSEAKGISRETRLGAYKSSFENRSNESIEEDFSVTGKFLGTDDFSGFLEQYLTAHPPATHFINELGRELPAFIGSHKPEGAAEFIDDLAKLEWLMIESFYNYFDHRTLRRAIAGTENVQLNSSLILLKSDWPLDEIWNEEKARDKKASYLSIWAKDDRIVRIKGWSQLQYQILKALNETADLNQTVTLALEHTDETKLAEVFQSSFQSWSEMGILLPQTAE